MDDLSEQGKQPASDGDVPAAEKFEQGQSEPAAAVAPEGCLSAESAVGSDRLGELPEEPLAVTQPFVAADGSQPGMAELPPEAEQAARAAQELSARYEPEQIARTEHSETAAGAEGHQYTTDGEDMAGQGKAAFRENAEAVSQTLGVSDALPAAEDLEARIESWEDVPRNVEDDHVEGAEIEGAEIDGAPLPAEWQAAEGVQPSEVAVAPSEEAAGMPSEESAAALGEEGAGESAEAAEAPVDYPDPEDPEAAVVEAILFASDSPLPASKISQVAELSGQKAVHTAVVRLNERYGRAAAAFRIEAIAGGYQMLTIPRYHGVLANLFRVKSDSRLSQAAMETLAIVAYRQPILRADIEAIRGVASGELLRSLLDKQLVKIVGRAEVLGRPMLYGTTKRFLEVFGLKGLEDLPRVEELKSGAQEPPGRPIPPAAVQPAGTQPTEAPAAAPRAAAAPQTAAEAAAQAAQAPAAAETSK